MHNLQNTQWRGNVMKLQDHVYEIPKADVSLAVVDYKSCARKIEGDSWECDFSTFYKNQVIQ